MKRTLFCVSALALFAFAESPPSVAADASKKIVLIAGKKSHGPVGNGIHDYGWSVRLLKVMLDNSNIKERVKVEVHLDGWPRDPKTLEDADSIMVVSDGRDGNLYEEAPHLASKDRVDWFDGLMKKGCGFVTFHFSTFAPNVYAEQILNWSGGYFQWETEGKRQWYSAIKTQESELQLGTPDHPVSRGIKPFTLREEFYFNIRFKPKDATLRPILVVPALKGREPDGSIVAWARERDGGGRGFGTTCGHFYDNWKNDAFRKLMLNAIAWSAKVEVPKDGVEAKFYSHEEIDKVLGPIPGVKKEPDTKKEPAPKKNPLTPTLPKSPLTPTLSPEAGEREKILGVIQQLTTSSASSLSPASGERVGVRGLFAFAVGSTADDPKDKPIRALLFAGNDKHKWHNWERTTPAIKDALERDPRIKVDVSLDIEDLGKKDLADYQVIVQNYCNWQDPKALSEKSQKAFVKFLAEGGGLVVIHFANGAFHFSLPMAKESDWPEYRKIVRRVWNHTPKEGEPRSGHDAFGKFTVLPTAVKHAITDGLKPFEVTDELYFNQNGDDAIEPLLVAESKVTKKKEPLAFAYSFGKGRVFQSLMGHSEKTYDTFEAREVLRRATAWSANREMRPLDKDGAAVPKK